MIIIKINNYQPQSEMDKTLQVELVLTDEISLVYPKSEFTISSQLEPLGYTAFVKWRNEDELPEDLTEEDYNQMFSLSKVDMVRLFPYVEIENNKYYLKVEQFQFGG